MTWQGGGGLVAELCPTLATPWTAAHQAPLSMGFPRQEHWSGLPFPSLGDLPDPKIEPASPALQADSLPLSHQARTQSNRSKHEGHPYSFLQKGGREGRKVDGKDGRKNGGRKEGKKKVQF